MKSHKFMKFGFFAVVLALLATSLLHPQTVSAHCTWYHLHHCSTTDVIREVDEGLTELDRMRIDILHLGGQGCLAKANQVIASNRTARELTRLEKQYLSPMFAHLIDLDKVWVYWGSDLNSDMKIGNWTVWVAADAQTFGYKVFFREQHDEGNTEQLISLAHELVHVAQYEKSGRDLLKFCQTYMDGFTDGGMDYHNNPYEKQAFDYEFRFAQSLENETSVFNNTFTYVHGMPNNSRTVEKLPSRLGDGEFYFKNNCTEPVRLLLSYWQPNGSWTTMGWWAFEPGKGSYLASSGSRIRSGYGTFYYYAEIPNASYSWSGNQNQQFNGSSYPMREVKLSTNSGKDWSLSIQCSNR